MNLSVEVGVTLLSVGMFVGTIAAIPWVVRRLPPDYFVRPPPKHSVARRIAQNVLGGLLIVAGILMLVLPGQGILSILVGLCITDFPGKQRAIRYILSNGKVQEGVQRMRSKVGKQPLIIPASAPSPA
jgi:hypothetical protein